MKTLIVCASSAHGNTRRVAEVLADELHATLVKPEDVDASLIAEYDLVGFGSGIYAMSFDQRLRHLVRALPVDDGRRAFVFATSGSPELPFFSFTRPLRNELARKGFDVVGSFTCRGLDTWGPLQLIGGINRGRPNERDLSRARGFAAELRERLETTPGAKRASRTAHRSHTTAGR